MKKKNSQKTIYKIIFSSIILSTNPVLATTSISQHGITWYFDKNYQTGRYANGDYWVLGPVKIIKITPESKLEDGWIKNGTQVNPAISNKQGYDSSIVQAPYDPELNVAPSIKKSALAIKNGSIISTISKKTPNNRPQILSASILTVVSKIPKKESFRPSPTGHDKHSLATASDLNYNILQSLPIVKNTPPLELVSNYFKKPWIEQNPSWTGRYIHPSENQPDYGREIANQLGEGLLSLHLNYTNKEKKKLFIRLVQYGLDVYGAAINGAVWEDLGGHNQGRKMPMLLAGIALNNPEILNYADASKHLIFQEDRQIWYVNKKDIGRKLYTGDGRPRQQYKQEDIGIAEWGEQHTRNPSRDGRNWDTMYRNIVGSSSISHALAAHLTYDAKERWNRQEFFDYYDRYWKIEHKNIGNGTNFISSFAGAMWEAYRELGEKNVSSIVKAKPSPPKLTEP